MKQLIWFTWKRWKEIYKTKSMKKILLSISVVLSVYGGIAQCDPNSYDWGGATFGVSPDPTIGETFEIGTVGQPYNDEIFVRTPATAQDVDPDILLNAPIDSLTLNEISFVMNGTELPISALGLSVTCNNNGVSPNPCMFFPSGNYCGVISGTPTAAGTFPVIINATVYITFFGSAQAVPASFDNYEIVIQEGGSVNVKETTSTLEVSLGNPSPNPSNLSTTIPFELTANGSVQFVVYNMLGEMVERRTVSGKRGANTLTVETQNLKSGVYLYSIQSGEKKITKRLMVQH